MTSADNDPNTEGGLGGYAATAGGVGMISTTQVVRGEQGQPSSKRRSAIASPLANGWAGAGWSCTRSAMSSDWRITPES